MALALDEVALRGVEPDRSVGEALAVVEAILARVGEGVAPDHIVVLAPEAWEGVPAAAGGVAPDDVELTRPHLVDATDR